jgi:tetratricopeptide (TPR) repeat protein
MGPEHVRLLEVAAVIGPDFDLQTLGQAAAYAEDDLVDGLDAASRARAVVATATPRTYAFAHNLVRETVYAGVSAVRRAYLHRRVGETLEALPGREDGPRAAALAYHFSAGGDPARALRHHAAAARAAASVGALDSGLGHCDAALEGIRDAGLGADPLVAVVALERGRLLHRAGRLTESVVSLEQALDGARALGDSQLEMQTLLELGYLRRNVAVPRALQPLEAACALAERHSDSGAQVRALSRSALVYADQLRLDRAVEKAEEALARARRAGDERLVADALDAHKLVAWQLGDSERLARLTAELETIQRRHRELWALSWTLAEAAQVPMAALRWRESEARLQEALALAERMDASVNAGFVLDSLAVVHEGRGAPEAGLVASERARALFERGASPSFIAWAQATAGLILIRLRAARRAAQHLEHGLAMAEQAGSRHAILRCTALLARARWLDGDQASGLAHAERAAELCDSIVAPAGRALLYVAPALACTAEVLAAAGRPDRGEALLSGALSAARRPDNDLYVIPLCIAAARCLAAQGAADAAQVTLKPALEAAVAGAFAPAWEAHVVLAAAGRSHAREARSAVAALSRGLADAELRTGFVAAAEREISQSNSAIKAAARRAPSVSTGR